MSIDEQDEAALAADLAALAALAEAEELRAQLVAAVFPDGPPALERATWPDLREQAGPGSGDPTADAETRLRHAEARFRTLVE